MLPQILFHDLAAHIAWQNVNELDFLGRLHARDFAVAKRNNRILIEIRFCAFDDKGLEALTPFLVRYPDHGYIGDAGMGMQDLLDLARINIDTT